MIVRRHRPTSGTLHNTVPKRKNVKMASIYYYLLLGPADKVILFGSINAYLGFRTLSTSNNYTNHITLALAVCACAFIRRNGQSGQEVSSPKIFHTKFFSQQSQRKQSSGTRDRGPARGRSHSVLGLLAVGAGLGRPGRTFRASRSVFIFLFPLASGGRGIKISPDPEPVTRTSTLTLTLTPLITIVIIGERGLTRFRRKKVPLSGTTRN